MHDENYFICQPYVLINELKENIDSTQNQTLVSQMPGQCLTTKPPAQPPLITSITAPVTRAIYSAPSWSLTRTM